MDIASLYHNSTGIPPKGTGSKMMIIIIYSERGDDIIPSIVCINKLTSATVSKYLWMTIYRRKWNLTLKDRLDMMIGIHIGVLHNNLSGKNKESQKYFRQSQQSFLGKYLAECTILRVNFYLIHSFFLNWWLLSFGVQTLQHWCAKCYTVNLFFDMGLMKHVQDHVQNRVLLQNQPADLFTEYEW